MTGVGAFIYGGRWNTPGHHVAYASGNLTLAMLELLVHVDDAEALRRIRHSYQTVRFPEGVVATLQEGDLPRQWDARPETRSSQVVGDEWCERQSTPILAVPSVIVPPELRYEPIYLNYLINPLHPDYASTVRVGPVYELAWDPRFD